MAFTIASVLLSLFVGNVAIGAVHGNPIVGNVVEMLILLGAAISFTVGILQREAAEKKTESD